MSKGIRNTPSPCDGIELIEGAARAPLLKSAAKTRASATAVSQRVTTKLVKVAKAFGLERYEIIFEANGQVRLAVGSAHIVAPNEAEPNDFDREFG